MNLAEFVYDLVDVCFAKVRELYRLLLEECASAGSRVEISLASEYVLDQLEWIMEWHTDLLEKL